MSAPARVTVRRVDIRRFTVLAVMTAMFVGAVVATDEFVTPALRGIAYVVSFASTGAIALIGIIRSASKARFSLELVHWYFVLVFFVIAPIGQFLTKSYRYVPTLESLLLANLLVTLWVVAYTLGAQQAYSRETVAFDWSLFVTEMNQRQRWTLAAVSVLAATTMLGVFGPAAFLTRALRSATIIAIFGEWGPVSQLLFRTVRPLSLLAAVVLVIGLYRREEARSPAALVATVIIALLALYVNNPAGGARFYALSVGFGLFLLVVLPRLTSSWLPFGLLVVALPFSQLFAIFRVATPPFGNTTVPITPLSYLLTPTFDAHENVAHTIRYTGANGFELGGQLLGGILFFIPRSLWPGKPVGSGRIVSEFLATEGYTILNTNIGIPLPAELYLNFGVVGPVLGGFVLGYAFGVFDERFALAIRRYIEGNERLDLALVLGVFSTGFVLLLLRGDFISGFAFAALFLAAWIVVVLVVRASA